LAVTPRQEKAKEAKPKEQARDYLITHRPIIFVVNLMSADEPHFRRCPHCDGKMKVARVIPTFRALPRLTVFQCLDCLEVITLEGDG
jgi:hypothetical protein